MHFAREFSGAQVPHWRSFYIDYEGLKTSLKVTYAKSLAVDAEPNFQGTPFRGH